MSFPWHKPRDEWGEFMNAQAKVSQDQDKEERELTRKNRELHRQVLEEQIREKEREKDAFAQQKRMEFQTMKLRGEAIKRSDELLGRKHREQQGALFKEYLQTMDYRFGSTQNGLCDEKNRDKAKLIQLAQSMKKESEERDMQRQRQVQQERDILLHKQREKALEQQRELSDKQLNEHLAKSRIELVNQRDQGLREFNQRKMQEMERKSDYFRTVLNQRNERELNEALLLSKWSSEHQERQLSKVELEREISNKALCQNNQTLKEQLSELKHRKLKSQHEAEKEAQEMNKSIEVTRNLETQQRESKKQNQLNYKNSLLLQIEESEQRKLDAFKLSNTEKHFNSKSFSGFPGVPGAQPRLSPLKASFDRAYRSFSVFPQRSAAPKLQNNLAFNLDKYDPIVNPIGESKPFRGFMRNGRALSQLRNN